MFRTLRWLSLTLLAVLLVPAVAWASTASSAPTLIFPWQQVWPIVIGALVPLVTYLLNHFAPWVAEPVKAVVLLVVSALATALYTALATNVIGFNTPTLQLILTGIGAALMAHKLLWQPSGISIMLGGGSNRVLKKPGAFAPPWTHTAPLGTVPVAPQVVAAPPAAPYVAGPAPVGAPPPPAAGV